jgi:hypothetical protein
MNKLTNKEIVSQLLKINLQITGLNEEIATILNKNTDIIGTNTDLINKLLYTEDKIK